MRAIAAIIATLVSLAVPAWAGEQPVTLIAGAGLEQVATNCSICHSLDYVQMNAPFLTPQAWQAAVGKMRAAYGAPISDENAARIVAYLAANYGPAK